MSCHYFVLFFAAAAVEALAETATAVTDTVENRTTATEHDDYDNHAQQCDDRDYENVPPIQASHTETRWN
jgi:hypothetical protein